MQVFGSFDEAERADDLYYASLTPKQRLEILFEMIAQYREGLSETEQRLERVCRITQYPQR